MTLPMCFKPRLDSSSPALFCCLRATIPFVLIWHFDIIRERNRFMLCAANMFSAIFDDVFNFQVLIMIFAININQTTNNY